MYKAIYLIIFITLSGCGIECLLNYEFNESSKTIKESKGNKVFQFEMVNKNNIIELDSGKTFKIKNAWIENSWFHTCINNKLVIKKNEELQLVLDGEYSQKKYSFIYTLWKLDNSMGIPLEGNSLVFGYSGEDSIILVKSCNVFRQRVLELCNKTAVTFYRSVYRL